MLNKIKEALTPGAQAEANSKRELLQAKQAFIAENSNTEDANVLLEVMASENTVKRLNKNIPTLQAVLDEAHSKASKLHLEYVRAVNAKPLLKEILPVCKVFDKLILKIEEGTLTANGQINKEAYMRLRDDINRYVEILKSEIETNDRNLQRHPELKGVI